jgi:hypothetical protein
VGFVGPPIQGCSKGVVQRPRATGWTALPGQRDPNDSQVDRRARHILNARTKFPAMAGFWRLQDRQPVRGHEKVPAGGQVEVPTGGQIQVPTPCPSCRSGTAGPSGDGEGANHSSSPPGSSIEVCEGPHGHHFCLSTSRVIPGRRRVVRHHPQDRQTSRGEVRDRRYSAGSGRAGSRVSASCSQSRVPVNPAVPRVVGYSVVGV